jgi:(R,R)-butanediol dehydrogenase / meso-butanediol dehydrogenase / diacetyl reductase
VVEPAAERRQAVARLGAEQPIDPTSTDAVGEVLERTAGTGARVVIDAAGVPASFRDALAVAGIKGRVVTVAAYMEPVSYNPTDLMMREVEIISSFAYCGDFGPVIEHMAAGRYPTDGWVERLAFDDHELAYERLHRGEAIKLLVDLPN